MAFKVTIRPLLHPNLFLFTSNDNHRNLGGDFDVRVHGSHEERNHFILDHLHDNVYHIRSATN